MTSLLRQRRYPAWDKDEEEENEELGGADAVES
jgi:hypothetical protein